MRCTSTTVLVQYICTFSPQVKSYFGLSKKPYFIEEGSNVQNANATVER